MDAVFIIIFAFFLLSPLWVVLAHFVDEWAFDNPDSVNHLMRIVRQIFKREVLKGDKKRVKNGTAVYVSYNTYMVLHESDPIVYPLNIDDNSEDILEGIRDAHNAVFHPKDARLLLKKVKKMREQRELNEMQKEEERDERELMEARKQAIASAERMLADVKRFAKQKEEELNSEVHKNIKLAAGTIQHETRKSIGI